MFSRSIFIYSFIVFGLLCRLHRARLNAGVKAKWKHGKTKTIRVPEVLAPQILEYSKKLDDEGIIENVSQSKSATNIIVTEKPESNLYNKYAGIPASTLSTWVFDNDDVTYLKLPSSKVFRVFDIFAGDGNDYAVASRVLDYRRNWLERVLNRSGSTFKILQGIGFTAETLKVVAQSKQNNWLSSDTICLDDFNRTRISDGYINATKLAKAYEIQTGTRKDVRDWLLTHHATIINPFNGRNNINSWNFKTNPFRQDNF